MSHYYRRDGSSCYEVERTDGKGVRNTSIRDARKLSLVPSVTTITGVLAKNGLTNWLMEQTIGACFGEDRQKEGEDFQAYTKRIIYASNKIGRKTAERGSYLHDLLEGFFSGQKGLADMSQEDRQYITPVIEAVHTDVLNSRTWEAERSFASPLGYGGKVDLSSQKPRSDGKKGYVLDFKTKNTTDPKKFYRYSEHLMQLAAYRHGLGMPEARCFDLYFSSQQPGIVLLHEWPEEELQKGWKQFEHLLKYWQLENDFDSSFVC